MTGQDRFLAPLIGSSVGTSDERGWGEGGGRSGSLLATHLPTVLVARRVAGPNVVWVVTGLVDRSCGIGWMSGRVAVLVPAATAVAASALWCSFLQVHPAPGSSSGSGSTLRLAFRQLLGCGRRRVD